MISKIYLLIFVLLIIYVNYVLFVNTYYLERPSPRSKLVQSIIYICGSRIVMSTKQPVTNLINPIQVDPARFATIQMDCNNGSASDTLAIRTVSFGAKNLTVCSKPTNFIAFADLDYCKLIKQFFQDLMNNCNYDDKLIEQIGSSRFGINDLNSNLLCSDNYSVPIYLSNDFCQNEIADLIKLAPIPIRDAVCVYNQFIKAFKFCSKEMQTKNINQQIPLIDLNKFEKNSFESWEETFISKTIVDKKCDGKNFCKLNINLDFPLEYAVENYQGQLLNITYRCTSITRYRTFSNKLYSGRQAATQRRNQQPFRSNLRLNGKKL